VSIETPSKASSGSGLEGVGARRRHRCRTAVQPASSSWPLSLCLWLCSNGRQNGRFAYQE